MRGTTGMRGPTELINVTSGTTDMCVTTDTHGTIDMHAPTLH